jgi:tetratricopeptide (TPR) repeat protein
VRSLNILKNNRTQRLLPRLFPQSRALLATPYPPFQSQRDCVLQPRVASSGLPWVIKPKGYPTLKGLRQRPIVAPGNKSGVAPLSGLKRWAPYILILFLVPPLSAGAHGEVHIQIANVTRQIASATNNPAKLYLRRAELHREDQTYDDAAADYDRAQQLDPALLPEIEFCRGRMLAQSGKLEQAHRALDTALNHPSPNPKAWIERGRVLVRLGKPQAAITDYSLGIEADKVPEPEPFLEVAHLLSDDGKPEAALRILDQGIRKFGPIPLLQVEAVQLELNDRRVDAALLRLDAIIQREPRKEHWYSRRGEILAAAGRLTEARAAYYAALGSIKLLPNRLQLNPPMQNLQAEINTALAKLTNAPTRAK